MRVSDEVFEQLKQSILLGQFKAGERLPAERDLAEEFQVSRVAIREALRNLENSGFINTRQGATGGASSASPPSRAPSPVRSWRGTTSRRALSTAST